MCANGDSADTQTEYRKEMEKDFVASPLGLGLMGYLVFRSGPVAVWKQLQAVGWGFAFVILLGGSLNWPDMRLGIGVYVRYQWAFLASQSIAPLISDGMGAVWCSRKAGWRGNANMAAAPNSIASERTIGRRD
jgi:hypothetical protein